MSAFRLGSFEVLEKAGSGGMGDIWRGVHVVQDVPVAIKVLRQSRAQDQRFKSLFRHEVRAVAQLDHPGIITVFDLGEVPDEAASASAGALEAGSPYLVMEYLERGSLESLGYPLPWPMTREILMAVLDGLAHAHARGITHRDLKPGNILLAERAAGSPIRLSDFGIAFSYRQGRATDADGTVSGTPSYMAPEQFLGEWRNFGPWTDLYGLGCVAYELASGQVPFEHPNFLQLGMAHVEHPPPELECPADYPSGFADWVAQLLAKKPASRYGRCADAAAALASLTTPAFAQHPDALPATTWALPAVDTASADVDWRAPAPPQRPFKLIGTGLRLYGLQTVPVVDRTAERDLLWAAFRRVAAEGMPGLVVLEGPAGAGKSRLAEWLCERTHELGLAECLTAEHEQARGRESALSHMLAAAWSCLGIGAAELQDRVTGILSSAGIESPAVHHAVAEFVAPAALGSEFSPGMFHEFPSRSSRFRFLFEALRHVYERRPLVVWLDDAHWGIDALLFLRYVLERAQADPVPILAVVTVRDDLLVESREALDLVRTLCLEDAAECVHLEPLSDADSRQLVSSLLHLEGDLAERVAVRSAGNPLYATQLVGDWVDRGILEAGGSGFVLAGPGLPDIPDDVHAVWIQRLDRVLDACVGTVGRTTTSAAMRAQLQVLLELAAALGGRVNMDEWVAVCTLAGVSDPSPVLQPLLASRLARLEPDSWAFSHGMLRDSIERIARERHRWASHNRLCADMLEQRRPVPHWGDSERIGRHRFAAAQYDAAMRPLLRGARERRRQEEYAAALGLLALYDRALDELGRAEDDPQRLEGWLLRADIHCTRQELQAAEELAHRVRALADDAERERFGGAALLVSARVHRQQGRLRTALDEYRDALRTLRITGPKHTLAACLSEQAHAMLEMGLLDRAWEAFHGAQEMYEEIGQLVPWAENQLGLARVAGQQGDVEHAMTLCRRVRGFGRREELSMIEATACAVLAEVQTAAGAPTDAMRSLDESIGLFEELGLERQALRARALKILLLLESGADERARLEFTQLTSSPEVDIPRLSRAVMSCVGLAIAVLGSAHDFESRLSQTEALLTGVEVPTPEVVRCLRLAITRAQAQGLLDRAARIERLDAARSTHRE